MPTAEKERTIEKAKEWYSKSSGVVFADYRGLKVREMQQLRSDLRKKGGELHVIKNTLFRIAAGEDTAKMPDELHNGTTAIAFVFENESACAKALFDYAKTSRKLVVKGGFFGGRALTGKQVETLSELPPRDILIAQVIGTIVAPLTGLIGVVEALYADPIRTIGAVADKVAESDPSVKAKAEPAAPAAAAEPSGPTHAAAPGSPDEVAADKMVAEGDPNAGTPAVEEPASETTNSAEAPASDASDNNESQNNKPEPETPEATE